MEPDGTYTKTAIGRGHKRFSAQEALMAMHGEIDESHL